MRAWMLPRRSVDERSALYRPGSRRLRASHGNSRHSVASTYAEVLRAHVMVSDISPGAPRGRIDRSGPDCSSKIRWTRPTESWALVSDPRHPGRRIPIRPAPGASARPAPAAPQHRSHPGAQVETSAARSVVDPLACLIRIPRPPAPVAARRSSVPPVGAVSNSSPAIVGSGRHP